MVRILNKENYISDIVKTRQGMETALVYNKIEGDKLSGPGEFVYNKSGQPYRSIVVPSTTLWEKSEPHSKLMQQIEDKIKLCKQLYEKKSNISQFPSDYYDLVDLIRLDITRRIIQEIDFTGIITNEIVNFNFSKTVRLDEFLPYAGAFKEMKFTGDSVPLLQQKTGATGTVDMRAWGIGHARSFEDILYNLDIFELQKVNEAVTRAYINLRNDLKIGPWIAITNGTAWAAGQTVAADATGSTYDEKLYLTLKNSRRALINLIDMQTEKPITTTRVNLMVGSQWQAEDILDVIGGQLDNGTVTANYKALKINEIQVYKGDTQTVGKETITYPGIAAGKGYMYVPYSGGAPHWTLTKRPIFMEMGKGDVHQFVTEKRAWGAVQTKYDLEFLGSSHPDYAGSDTDRGYIVEVNLPTP